ncbi:hypothetical protein [Streptomyces sp. AGS-58]|uniref:hypothetical protein n=1 Tax=unclassified Streptomyces TaxID=2593676 RepID=UPI0035A2AF9D
MSIVIKFFVAPDAEAAAAVAEGGPDGVFESLTFGNFDVEAVRPGRAASQGTGLRAGPAGRVTAEELLDDRGACP